MSKRARISNSEEDQGRESGIGTGSRSRTGGLPEFVKQVVRDEFGLESDANVTSGPRTQDGSLPSARNDPVEKLDVNDWMAMADSVPGASAGGMGTGSAMPMIFPKIYAGASRAWTTEVYILGGASNNLNTYDLFNLACKQLSASNSYAVPLTSPTDDPRCTQIQALLHSINVVGANTNTVVSVAPQYSGDGSMPSVMNSGTFDTAPANTNETQTRPLFLHQRQEIQLPTTGASMSSVFHSYDASPHNRPWFLTTNAQGRAYAAITAAPILADGAAAAWVAFVKVTFRPTQAVAITEFLEFSNMDNIEEMNRKEEEYRQEYKEKYDMLPDIEEMTNFRNNFISEIVETKQRLAEKKRKVRLERELGMNSTRDF